MPASFASLRVLTLNLWNRGGPWPERLSLIRDELARLEPDVVGLQEVIELGGETQAHEVAAGLFEHVAWGKGHDVAPGVGFGNAVLSRWPLARTEVRPLPHGDGPERRSVLYAEVSSPRGALPIFVTHLNWKLHEGVVRERQVLALDRVAAELAPPDALPAILMGDLNAVPESAELRFLLGLGSLDGRSTHWADCFGERGEGPGYTFDRVGNAYAAQGRERPRRIDYVLVRGPDELGRGQPLTARVALTEPRDGVFASDHFGVLAEVTF